jgi:hypothetical protein
MWLAFVRAPATVQALVQREEKKERSSRIADQEKREVGESGEADDWNLGAVAAGSCMAHARMATPAHCVA